MLSECGLLQKTTVAFHFTVQEEVERFEAVEQQYGLTSVLSGRGGTTSAMGRSLYGGTQSIGGVVVKVPSTGARPAQVRQTFCV